MQLPRYSDEYLIGITNKGIVKRSYKDLEKLEIVLTQDEETITLSFEGVTVILKSSIQESTCTCPSRTTCKHIVTSVLYIQGQDQIQEVEKNEVVLDIEKLLAYDEQILIKALTTATKKQLIHTIQNKHYPEIKEEQIITVFLKKDLKVTFVDTVENAICTCKSSHLCQHKALAMLYIMAYKGKVLEIEQNQEKLEGADWESSKVLAREIREELAQLLSVGLSRTSQDQIFYLEKMALIAHTEKLANHERLLKQLANLYKDYFNRNVHFSEKQLLHTLTQAYQLSIKIEEAESLEEFQQYAGVFKEMYYTTQTMTLLLIGERWMETKGGYSGYSYYFLCQEDHKIYSYADLRPTEHIQRSIGPHIYRSMPWGLDCPVEFLMKHTFILENPKVNRQRQLSSSKESRAKVKREAVNITTFIKERIVTDFRTCIYMDEPSENDKVAIVRIEEVVQYGFDQLTQTFKMTVIDEYGYTMDLEVKYSKANESIIKMLENDAKNIGVDTLFIGIIYIEQNKLKMFPIEFIKPTKQQSQEAEG